MRPPGHLAQGIVVAATSALPRGEVRQRYRREMLADLFATSRARRLGYALGVAFSAWSLRNAVAGTRSMEATMTVVKPKRPLLCRLNLRHRWFADHAEDGTRYLACARCGKERVVDPLVFPGA